MLNSNILVISSSGGHFVQLSMLSNQLNCKKLVAVGTYLSQPTFINCDTYYSVSDFSRDNVHLAIKVFIQSIKILIVEKPELIITTGAAPGLIMLICSKLFKVKGLWIDSLANSKELSFSAKIARFLGFKVLTQSIQVSNKYGVEFHGRVI